VVLAASVSAQAAAPAVPLSCIEPRVEAAERGLDAGGEQPAARVRVDPERCSPAQLRGEHVRTKEWEHAMREASGTDLADVVEVRPMAALIGAMWLWWLMRGRIARARLLLRGSRAPH
jgi:hypothetical protein